MAKTGRSAARMIGANFAPFEPHCGIRFLGRPPVQALFQVRARHVTSPTPTYPERILRYRNRPIRFLLHYAMRHKTGHFAVLASVVLAVVCAVSTQYGMKRLIDVIAHGPHTGGAIWSAFAVLCALIAGDNLLWRV